ncbi:glycosyltransferase family 4 protein [Colwellia sp. MB02u-6]|uniref:glycosyltransferase family 4 protein n=1 Tax=Colwellia sp. MB02u-6 TaxID=2759824 RepID=UPI0015F72FB1|nr:glycosyltransferase family 4 protein [Colwellia sp. MB02u-6]MBA6326357.1 glycosyltransferase family 4 protein [Colwellia sp. MB02u-6]
MNVCYVHDFCLYRDEKGRIYTAVGLPEKYFDRFFNFGCTNVSLITRNRKENKTSIRLLGFTKINTSKINLPVPINSYMTLFSPTSIFKIIRTIKRSDLLVINFPSLIGLLLCFLNIFIKKKYILEVAADGDQFSSKKGGLLITLLFKMSFNFFVRKSSGAIYVSNFLRNKYPHSEGVISSNVYIDKVHYPVAHNQSLQVKKSINILFAGGVNKRKGISTLLESIKQLVNNGNNKIMLNIAGGHFDSDYEATVKNMELNDNIKFHGLLDKVELIELYRNADIYVQPSIAEGIPRAAIEAMSFGLPVIATSLPGFEEILPRECLVKTGSFNEIVIMIEKVINDAPFRNKLSFTNSKRAEDFLLPILDKKRSDFYNKILGRK